MSDNNHGRFTEIVGKLENGACQEVIDILDQAEDRESYINVGDVLDGDIPEHAYRYRPIKRRGFTLLHYAMIFGTPEVVKHLLDYGADPMANTKSENRQHGYSVIHMPCYLGKIEALTALLNHKKMKESKKTLVNDSYVHINELGVASNWKWTPIHYACEENNNDILELLLQCEADPFVNDGGFSYACKVSNSEIVETLLRKSTKDTISSQINKKDRFGKTPLHHGGRKDYSKTVNLLISKGADPTIEDSSQKNSIFYAIDSGNEACALQMLEAKQVTKSVIHKFFTEDIVLKCIEKNLPLVLSKLLQLCHQAQRTAKIMECLLHEVMLMNLVDLNVFSQIVKFSGKLYIEDKDDKGRTPMLLAASLNLHKELNILFTIYIDILQENYFFYKNEYNRFLYTDIVAKKDNKGLSIAHLAVQCIGSDSDFEDTVKNINDMWKKLKEIDDNTIKAGIPDPFLMKIEDCEQEWNISPIQLACKINQTERILHIVEVTKARTLFHLDADIIHWALKNRMLKVDFEKLCSLIVMFLHGNSEILKKVFNMEAAEATPLHLALKQKQFAHVKIMLRLKYDDGQEIVHFKSGDSSTLHEALIHSAPRYIMKQLLERIKKDEWRHFPLVTHSESKSQIDLPVSVTKADVIHNVLEEASKLFNQEQYSIDSTSLEKLLNDSVDHKRMDIFEMVTVSHEVIFKSTLHKLLFDAQNEDFVRIAVRYSKFTELLAVLTQAIHCTSADDENTTFFNELIKKMPEVAMEALNRSWDNKSTTTLLQHPKKLKPPPGHSGISGENEEPQPTNDASTVTHPLDIMVQTQDKELLQHPLVKDYLNSQWLAGAFWMYCIQITLHLCFVGFLSSLVLILHHPSDSACNSLMKENSSTENIKNGAVIFGLSILSFLFMILQVIFAISRTIFYINHKCCFKCVEVKSFILSPEIWLIPTTICTVLFLGISINVSIQNSCHGNESWTLGVFTIILAWTYLTFILNKLPYIGHYAIIFAAICWTFFKLMFFAIFLLLASSLVMRMIFYNPSAPYSPFSNFGEGVAMVISMITGDFGYQESFGLSFSPEFTRDHELYDRNMANFIWILFVVLIPILLSNMLTSLAVGDTNEIQKNADLKFLELKVNWVTRNRKCWVPQCCTKGSTKFCNLYNSKAEAKTERNLIIEYHKRLEYDRKEIIKKYSEIPGGSDAEVLETVQEVTNSNQRKLREIKIIHDKALNRLHKGQAQLKKQLESH